MKYLKNPYSITLVYFVVVCYFAFFIPILPYEAENFYEKVPILTPLMQLGFQLFPIEFGVRIFSILSGVIGVVLFYIFALEVLKKRDDALLATFIFSLLPIVIFGGAVANITMLVFDFVLLFLLSYFKKCYIGQIVFAILVLAIHQGSIVFFLALLLFFAIKKEKKYAFASLLFVVWILFYQDMGIKIFSHPRGHFVDIFSIYAFAFSPFIFLYLLYAFYRIWIKENKDIVWSIASFAIFISILLSIRQRVYIVDYIPYILVGFVLLFKIYFQSIRVRLPHYQTVYKNGFYVSIGVQLILLFVMILLPLIFAYSGKYYISKIYKPYKIALDLKSKGVSCYDSSNYKERLQLKFYNISFCKK